MARLCSVERGASARFAQLLAAAETAGLDLELAEIPEALGELERVRVRLTFRALSAGTPSDTLLKVGPASDLLGIAEETLYRRANEYPFTVRDGRGLRFSRTGIEKFIRSQQGRP
jgi:hypothetical protein